MRHLQQTEIRSPKLARQMAEAILCNDEKTVTDLLEQGVNPNFSIGLTPVLMLAALANTKITILKKLINYQCYPLNGTFNEETSRIIYPSDAAKSEEVRDFLLHEENKAVKKAFLFPDFINQRLYQGYSLKEVPVTPKMRLRMNLGIYEGFPHDFKHHNHKKKIIIDPHDIDDYDDAAMQKIIDARKKRPNGYAGFENGSDDLLDQIRSNIAKEQADDVSPPTEQQQNKRDIFSLEPASDLYPPLANELNDYLRNTDISPFYNPQ